MPTMAAMDQPSGAAGFMSPEVFGEGAGPGAPWRAKVLGVASRLAAELSLDVAGGTGPTAGERILAQPQSALVTIGDTDAAQEFAGNYGRPDRQGAILRRAYGFEQWVGAAGHGARISERVLVSLAADARFDDYARGFWDATATARTILRVDLRSVCALVWGWGMVDEPALARALVVARRHPESGQAMSFRPFTELFARVLRLHLPEPDVERRAEWLSRFTIERMRTLGVGRSPRMHLFVPLSIALAEHPDADVALDLGEPSESHSERLARAALPLLLDLRNGAIEADEARRTLETLLGSVDAIAEPR